MNILVLGPQGSGKGTQAQRIKAMYGVPHIATGDIIRQQMELMTELGREVKEVYDRGDLVSDELMIRLIRDRLSRGDTIGGFVLDGYPRTVDQAEALEKMLKESARELDAVVSIVVAEDVVVERMLGRGRADDSEEVIRNRMRVYREETEPLLEHYDGQVVAIDGVGSVEEVNARILQALGH